MRASAVRIQTWILDGSGMLVPVESFAGSVAQTGFVHGAITLTILERTIFPGGDVEWIDHVWCSLASDSAKILAGSRAGSTFPLQSLAYELAPEGGRARVESRRGGERVSAIVGARVLVQEIVRAGRSFWTTISQEGRVRPVTAELATLDRLEEAAARHDSA